MNTAQNYYLSVRTRKQWSELFDLLTERGVLIPSSLSKRKLPPYKTVFLSLEKNYLSPVNVCCMAAAASQGIRPIDVEKFFALFSSEQTL